MSLLTAAASQGDISLSESRAFCAQLTKTEARNFYYGLKLLPEHKRTAMFALYAYMRLVDDIADGENGRGIGQRMEALDSWKESTEAALAGRRPVDGHAVWPAFAEMVRRFGVPANVFSEVIAGQRQDLELPVFHSFEELREYCYRVAGVVGVASIHIWGFEGGVATEALAVDRGIAFQLTNILRDLREDAGRGRVYLPRQELESVGLSLDRMGGGEAPEAFVGMMNRQVERAESYYQKSSPLEKLISADSRPTLVAMTHIYHGLLKKIKQDPCRVLRQRITLSPLTKARIAWRAMRSR